ncbi:surface-adhesin E family protein [Anaerovibrio sp. RM50]|uniref:surface-adhesin E family protein n=1 Tax=Anaerovibrio sp. RM50 TaxID=1200557 RepID=UPI0012EB6610|nr:surface-adhesin E family protein [Anaerovibrio sp. RM50]
MRNLFIKLFFIAILLVNLPNSTNAAMQDDGHWHWLISDENMGMFVNTDTIRYTNSNDKINKKLLSGWFLYVYDSTHAEKYLDDPNIRYGKVLAQIDKNNKKLRNLQQVFYDYNEQPVSTNNKIQAWEYVIPGTNGEIIYNALVEYSTKFSENVEKNTQS